MPRYGGLDCPKWKLPNLERKKLPNLESWNPQVWKDEKLPRLVEWKLPDLEEWKMANIIPVHKKMKKILLKIIDQSLYSLYQAKFLKNLFLIIYMNTFLVTILFLINNLAIEKVIPL